MIPRWELVWHPDTHELRSRSGRLLMVGSIDACAIAYLGVVIKCTRRWGDRW